jgi:aryl carrier-like protein
LDEVNEVYIELAELARKTSIKEWQDKVQKYE